MSKSVKITVSNLRNDGSMDARFDGPRATIKECPLIMIGGDHRSALRAADMPDNGRRLIPVDPFFWLHLMEKDSMEIEVVFANEGATA